MAPGELHGRVAVDVGQQPQAEALRVGGVGEAIHGHGGLRGVEGLPHPLVELVVGYGAPEGRLTVGHGLQVCTKQQPNQPQQGKGGWKNKQPSWLEYCSASFLRLTSSKVSF